MHSARWCNIQELEVIVICSLHFSKYRFQTWRKPDQRSSSWTRRCLQWAPAACSSKARQTRRVPQAADLLPGCWRGRDVGVREGSFLAVYRLWTWSEQCHGPVEQTWGMRMKKTLTSCMENFLDNTRVSWMQMGWICCCGLTGLIRLCTFYVHLSSRNKGVGVDWLIFRGKFGCGGWC